MHVEEDASGEANDKVQNMEYGCYRTGLDTLEGFISDKMRQQKPYGP